jgi:uncharacterized DUF497 family protein
MLDFDFIEWDDANEDHIADNGLSIFEGEAVLYDPRSTQTRSKSTGRPALVGGTSTGKTIVVIYKRCKDGNDTIVRPVTAYEIED